MNLSVKETARRLGVCPKTVYRLCWNRLLRHIKIGRALRIPEDALDEYHREFGAPACYAST